MSLETHLDCYLFSLHYVMCGFHKAPMIITGSMVVKQSSVSTKLRQYPGLFA